MFSRTSYLILHRSQRILTRTLKYSTSTHESDERDPAPLFFRDDVQTLLKTLTCPDMNKLFRKRKDGRPIKDAVYKFLTDEELQKHIKEAEERGMKRLQMPPVIKIRKENNRILSKDPALQGYDTAKYIFTDITYPMNNYERLIVVREPDGILREVTWDERQRFNQIYYPVKGREMNTPRMFNDPYLKDILDRAEYEFVLDRACVQFEPNDPEYHRVTKTVYSVVNAEKHFNSLRSTRHYGPLVFHLVWTNNIENLLIENLKTERLKDAVLLIKLYGTIYPHAECATLKHDGDDMKYMEDYLKLEPASGGKLLATLQALKEIQNARKAVEEGVKKAHGM